MEYSLFQNKKKININDNLIKEYETNVAPFNSKRAEYLAITSGVDENNNDDDIKKGIIEGIYEEINIYKDKYNIIKQAKEMNLIP